MDKNLEKPFEQYIRCWAEIFFGTKLVITKKIKCFLWVPQLTMEEPHFYLLIENDKESYYYNNQLSKNIFKVIDLKVSINDLNGQPINNYLIKSAIFSQGSMTSVAENWHEAFFKYHSPRYVVNKLAINGYEQDNKFNFFISESKFLSSDVLVEKHYTGEIHKENIFDISLLQEVSHLGIKSVISNKYIGEKESNILQIIPCCSINSLLGFYKTIKPVVDLILALTSFAERRRLNWYKCEGVVGVNFIENYNTRVLFYQDRSQESLLIGIIEFENFLRTTLSNIGSQDVKYVTKLLRAYLSGRDYTANAQIILWNSILEKILKKRFDKKADALKSDLIEKMSVNISDLSPIRVLTDIRNKIAHGDEQDSVELLMLTHEWRILIERVLLSVLNWNDLSATNVDINRKN